METPTLSTLSQESKENMNEKDICLSSANVDRTSIDLMKENGFILKKSIRRRYYEEIIFSKIHQTKKYPKYIALNKQNRALTITWSQMV